LKEEILKILQSYSEDSGNPYFPFQYIHDDYIESITNDILELLKSQGIIKLSNDVDFNKNY